VGDGDPGLPDQFQVDGDCSHTVKAADLLRRYAREKPSDPNKAAIEIEAAALEKQTCAPPEAVVAEPQLEVLTTPEGAEVRVDLPNGPPARAPVIQAVSAGAHTVYVTLAEYEPVKRVVEVPAGRLVVLHVELRQEPAVVALEVEEVGSRVWVDGTSRGESPLEGPIELDKGEHCVAVTRRGRTTYRGLVHLKPGDRKDLFIDLSNSRQRWASYAVLGAAALLAGGAVYAGVRERRAEEEAAGFTQPPEGRVNLADLDAYNGAVDDSRAWGITTNVFIGTGIAALLTGSGLWYFDAEHEQRESVWQPGMPCAGGL
jgi:hypothetical protein